MDPELTKLLIETLKDAHASATPMFQELVRQRVVLCCWEAAMLLITFGVAATVFVLGYKWQRSKPVSLDAQVNAEVGGPVVMIFSALFAVPALLFAMHNVACALAPLGGVLGKIQ